MKYIFRDENGAFELSKYEEYLDRERNVLVGLIQGQELLRIDRFVPADGGSFHDARFERFVADKGSPKPGGGAPQAPRLELRLKGPFFDRHFELTYDGVESCSFEMPSPEDDLLMHELRLDEGRLVHELWFDHENAIVITCRSIRFSETRD